MSTPQEKQIKKGIPLQKSAFLDCGGLFPTVFAGKITQIATLFQQSSSDFSQGQVLALITQRDQLGRTPVDIASHLGFQNIAVYLSLKMGTPSDMIFHELNLDNQGLNAYHIMAYKGNYDCLVSLLCFERMCLKKVMYDQLQKEKNRFRMKTMDIKQGELVKTVQHDADTIKRHREFDLRLVSLFEQYACDIIARYREILTQQDTVSRRNPLHFAAMNKYTKCHKTLEALLKIDIDVVEGFDQFLQLFMQIQNFENAEDTYDPRRSVNILHEFKQLISPRDYEQVVRDFKSQAKLLLKEVLNQQDGNYHSPLHVASYFGASAASRTLIRLGAEPRSAAFATNPLEIGKDKFTRSVVQNLNKAATQANSKDLRYLVNCGDKIDERMSIFGEAPIHKAVLSNEEEKTDALEAIIEDCHANVNNIDSNGWTPLHHAANIGDFEAAGVLVENGAKVNSYSNQQRTPLHLCAANNHVELVQALLINKAEMEWQDDLKCTPLHLACKRGSLEAVILLLQSGANIYAQDHRQWTPLHYSAYNGHARVCNTLLKWEADNDVLREVRTTQNKLAFNLCKSDNCKKAFQHIWRACKNGDLDAVRILLREGQDVNEQTQTLRNTPLHIAAKHGHLLIVKYLIDNGALPNYANANGFSPYELAHQSIEIVSNQAFAQGSGRQGKGQISQLEAAQIIASLQNICSMMERVAIPDVQQQDEGDITSNMSGAQMM